MPPADVHFWREAKGAARSPHTLEDWDQCCQHPHLLLPLKLVCISEGAGVTQERGIQPNGQCFFLAIMANAQAKELTMASW